MKRLLVGCILVTTITSLMLFARPRGGAGAGARTGGSGRIVRSSGAGARSSTSMRAGRTSAGHAVRAGGSSIRRVDRPYGRSHSVVTRGIARRARYNGFIRDQGRRYGRSYWSSRWNRYYRLWPSYGWGWWYNNVYYDELAALCQAYPDAPPCEDYYY